MRNLMAGAAALVLLGACGGKAPETVAATEVPAVTSPVAAAAPFACTGATLTITGACADANPALFVAIDESRQPFQPTCKWKTQEVKLSDAEMLVFRAQDCAADPDDAYSYSFEGRAVKYRIPTMDPGDWMSLLDIYEVGTGQTAEQVALTTLSDAPAEQRARCETLPKPGPKVAGHVFELGPNAELQREIETAAGDEPWDACGPHGVTTDSSVFWEGRQRHALFHMTGQDDPIWDVASFTFYVKNPDGSWSKKD